MNMSTTSHSNGAPHRPLCRPLSLCAGIFTAAAFPGQPLGAAVAVSAYATLAVVKPLWGSCTSRKTDHQLHWLQRQHGDLRARPWRSRAARDYPFAAAALPGISPGVHAQPRRLQNLPLQEPLQRRKACARGRHGTRPCPRQLQRLKHHALESRQEYKRLVVAPSIFPGDLSLLPLIQVYKPPDARRATGTRTSRRSSPTSSSSSSSSSSYSPSLSPSSSSSSSAPLCRRRSSLGAQGPK